MDLAYSTRVNELFTKGRHHRNISLGLMTLNVFHQGTPSRNISLNKCIRVSKDPRAKTDFVHLARNIYPENISSSHETYLDTCRDAHNYLYLDITID